MISYLGYEIEIRKTTPESGWPHDHYYIVRWGGVEVSKHPTREFAEHWIDQVQARFERLS